MLLPSLMRSRELVEAVLAASYRLADAPVSAPEVPAIHIPAAVGGSVRESVRAR